MRFIRSSLLNFEAKFLIILSVLTAAVNYKALTLVSLAISKANGGSLFVNSFRAAGFLILRPSAPAFINFVLQFARVRMTGSARPLRLLLPVSP